MSKGSNFLGTGWGFPPIFSASGADVQMVSAQDDIEQSLAILFSTQRGERVMQEDYGCDLESFLFSELNHGLAGSIRNMIEDAILHHEPRIKLNNLDVSEGEYEAGLLLISLDYTIRSTNSRFNMVYPYYLNEAILPG